MEPAKKIENAYTDATQEQTEEGERDAMPLFSFPTPCINFTAATSKMHTILRELNAGVCIYTYMHGNIYKCDAYIS